MYGWGTPAFDGNLLVTNIGRVLEYLAAEVSCGRCRARSRNRSPTALYLEADAARARSFHQPDQGLGFDSFDVGVMSVNLFAPALPAALDGGIGISPFAVRHDGHKLRVDRFAVARAWSICRYLQGGLALILRAGRDPTAHGLFDPPATAMPRPLRRIIRPALRNSAAAGGRAYVLFSAPGSVGRRGGDHGRWRRRSRRRAQPLTHASVEDGRIRLVPDRPGWLSCLDPAGGRHHDEPEPHCRLVAARRPAHPWRRGPAHHDRGVPKVGPLQLDTLDLALTARRMD